MWASGSHCRLEAFDCSMGCCFTVDGLMASQAIWPGANWVVLEIPAVTPPVEHPAWEFLREAKLTKALRLWLGDGDEKISFCMNFIPWFLFIPWWGETALSCLNFWLFMSQFFVCWAMFGWESYIERAEKPQWGILSSKYQHIFEMLCPTPQMMLYVYEHIFGLIWIWCY